MSATATVELIVVDKLGKKTCLVYSIRFKCTNSCVYVKLNAPLDNIQHGDCTVTCEVNCSRTKYKQMITINITESRV